MKKIIPLAMALTLSGVSVADSTKSRKTTTTIEERSTSPVMNSEVGPDSEMLEAEEYDDYLDAEEVEEERMEEKAKDDSFIKSEEEINYQERTRTNRERKAINTGSDASDDE